MKNSFDSRATLASGNRSYTIYRLPALAARGFDLSRLPFSLKILLENLLRREDGVNVTAADIEFLAKWEAKAEPSREIAYMPARVLMQDFTGVPAIVDLGAMRDAIHALGGDPERVNPLVPAELVIDHSVQVDEFGAPGALATRIAKVAWRDGDGRKRGPGLALEEAETLGQLCRDQIAQAHIIDQHQEFDVRARGPR